MTNAENDPHDQDDEEQVDLPPAISLEREEVIRFNHHPNRPRNSS